MTTANTTVKPESPLLGRGRGEASYFSIQELTASATALREGIDNRPSKCAYHLLHVLVDQLLDPIREAWGEPIVVSSTLFTPPMSVLSCLHLYPLLTTIGSPHASRMGSRSCCTNTCNRWYALFDGRLSMPSRSAVALLVNSDILKCFIAYKSGL